MTRKVKKIIFFVLLAVVVISGALIALKVQKSNKEVVITTTPGNVFSKGTPTPQVISGDFPPLYPEVEWGEPKYVDRLIFRKESGELFATKGVILESPKYQVYDSKFFEYYSSTLKSKGWLETNSAGGPEGELYYFQNKDKHIIVEYRVEKDKTGPEGKVTGYKYYLQYN